jgi:hypothetical protein
MSITRRQFMLSTAGAAVGAIIPSFYYRALQFLEQFGEPLLEAPARITEDLTVVDFNGYPELCLGDPYTEPPEMTYLEYFTRYSPDSHSLDDFKEEWGLVPSDLDRFIDYDFVINMWSNSDSPSASAYYMLDSLDLGQELCGPNAVGGLEFLEESNMVNSSWLVVRPRDEVTLSLLQQRLNDLDTGIRVVSGYTA